MSPAEIMTAAAVLEKGVEFVTRVLGAVETIRADDPEFAAKLDAAIDRAYERNLSADAEQRLMRRLRELQELGSDTDRPPPPVD